MLPYIAGALAGLYLLAAFCVGWFFCIAMQDDFATSGHWYEKIPSKPISFLWSVMCGLVWPFAIFGLLWVAKYSNKNKANYGKALK